jgi:hypothetical protein
MTMAAARKSNPKQRPAFTKPLLQVAAIQVPKVSAILRCESADMSELLAATLSWMRRVCDAPEIRAAKARGDAELKRTGDELEMQLQKSRFEVRRFARCRTNAAMMR